MRVLAYHLIMTNYGFWLPNEPRGSWSEVVRAFELLAFGPATKINTTRSVAHKPYDRNLRRKMNDALARSRYLERQTSGPLRVVSPTTASDPVA